MIETQEALKKQLAQFGRELTVAKKAAIRLEKSKAGKKRAQRQVDPNKQPTGFAKPAQISEALRQFLQLESGALIARTEVTREICKYIRNNDLKDEANKKQIDLSKPGGQALRELLQPDQPLTFFNLQRFLKRHISSVGETGTSMSTDATSVAPSVVVKKVGKKVTA